MGRRICLPTTGFDLSNFRDVGCSDLMGVAGIDGATDELSVTGASMPAARSDASSELPPTGCGAIAAGVGLGGGWLKNVYGCETGTVG